MARRFGAVPTDETVPETLGGGGSMAQHGNEYHEPDFEEEGVAAGLVAIHEGASNSHPTYTTDAEAAAIAAALDHPLAHTLGSHTTKAHSELDGIGPGDHHTPESGESGTHVHDARYYTETEHGGVSPQGHHGPASAGADGQHSFAAQVLSGVDAGAAQKGHVQLAGDLGGTAAAPQATQARGLRETSGPTTLGIGDIPDGKYLKRSGATIVGDMPAGGSNDPRITTRALSADQGDITGITLVEIVGLTVANLPVGVYVFQYYVLYQTTATTTGVEFVVDHTGTDSAFVSNAKFGSTGGTAATGIADQVGVGTAAGLMEVKTQRASGARPGVTIGVDTANANCLMVIEGVIVTTSIGDLKLMMAAELASLVVRAKAGSGLILTKVS